MFALIYVWNLHWYATFISWNQMVLNQWKTQITLQILLPFSIIFLWTDALQDESRKVNLIQHCNTYFWYSNYRWMQKPLPQPLMLNIFCTHWCQVKHNSATTGRLAKWFASIYCPYILLFFSEELITGEIKLFKSCHHSPTNITQ